MATSDDKGTATDDKGKADDKGTATDDKGTATDDKGKADDKGTATDDKGTATDDKGKADDKGVKEYEAFTPPEGQELDKELVGKLGEFGKKHGLSQEAAQEALDLHTTVVKEVLDKQQDAWKGIKDGWENEVKANKKMQDDKGNVDAALAIAELAVDKLGGDDLREALDITGAGSHPAVVSVFHQIGLRIKEDTTVFGGSATDTRTQAQKMYPTMKS